MTEQEHGAAGLCNILWKGAEQRAGVAPASLEREKSRFFFSPKTASDAQSILLYQAQSCGRAGGGVCSELSEEGEISAVASTKPSMKGWEQGNLFSACTQQQAQAFPAAVTQQNLA